MTSPFNIVAEARRPAVRLVVHGIPASQGSHNSGRRGQVYERNPKVRPWRDAVKAEALKRRRELTPAHGVVGAAPWLNGPLYVFVDFWLPRPPSHYRRGSRSHLLASDAPAMPATRPDLDKYTRATLDGMQEGWLYRDDGQICALQVSKRYSNTGESSGAYIVVGPWPGSWAQLLAAEESERVSAGSE